MLKSGRYLRERLFTALSLFNLVPLYPCNDFYLLNFFISKLDRLPRGRGDDFCLGEGGVEFPLEPFDCWIISMN